MHSKKEKKHAGQHIVNVILEPYLSREGGDIEPVRLSLEGAEDEPMAVRAEYVDGAVAEKRLSKVDACAMEIKRTLRQRSGNE